MRSAVCCFPFIKRLWQNVLAILSLVLNICVYTCVCAHIPYRYMHSTIITAQTLKLESGNEISQECFELINVGSFWSQPLQLQTPKLRGPVGLRQKKHIASWFLWSDTSYKSLRWHTQCAVQEVSWAGVTFNDVTVISHTATTAT